MPLLKVILLAIVQGLAELLPVSSSAHVIVAEKLMHLDPSAPSMTLLLVMLHTGTMFAVIVYFWKQWRRTYFSSANAFQRFLVRAIWASALTAIVYEGVKKLIEHTLLKGQPHSEIESLFSRLDLIAPALLAAGILILIAGLRETRAEKPSTFSSGRVTDDVTFSQAGWLGLVQGICLPFRGFSRSGATISTGLLLGVTRERAERFSFALAVILTPAAIAQESLRFVKASHAGATAAMAANSAGDLHSGLAAAALGAVFSFLAGLVALKWLSSWLENGRWYFFGIYCLAASAGVFYLHHLGY
jgi:undecaprenyl-diphosphatase